MIKCSQTGGYPPTVLLHGIIRLCGLLSEVIISQFVTLSSVTAVVSFIVELDSEKPAMILIKPHFSSRRERNLILTSDKVL